MVKIENFINENLNEFSLLENSEVKEYSIDEIDKDIVDYLKDCFRQRYDYKSICVYYVEDYNKVWVENLDS